MTQNGATVLEGTVEATNERGLRLGGEWLNVSKFKPIPLPAPGARVRAEVDAKGFLKSVDVLDDAPATAPQRDDTAVRLAVLQAAASFLGQMGQARSEVRSEHVLVLADRWLAWIEAET
jgi:hypothetical protein